MKRNWELEDLIEHFTFLPNELALTENKVGDARLGFAVMFKFFQYEARFPYSKNEIPKVVIEYIAKQIKVDESLFEHYELDSRTYFSHKAQIREFFGFREPTAEDTNNMTEWLCKHVLYYDLDIDHLKTEVLKRFRELHIEPPTPDRVDRLTKSAIYTYENQFFQDIYQKLSKECISRMDCLINDLTTYDETEIDYSTEGDSMSFSELRADPGRIGLESVFREVVKLKTIQQLGLPENLFSNMPQKVVKKYKLRAVSEDIRELRRHPEPVRYTLLSAFFWLRCREITDNLIELLIQIIHRISVRAERKVEKQFINDFKKVNGKTNILFQMADAALNNPDGIVRQVLYPVVSENTLKAIVKEFKNTGAQYRQKVYTVMRASYANHYRRMVPQILDTLEFRSNNEVHQPVIKALELIKKYYNIGSHYFSDVENIPIEGVIRSGMREAVIEKDEEKGIERINRMNYEIVALQALRDKLRCKEIWVVGADRYRNPDEDLPTDFEERREENYRALKQPLDADEFINKIRQAMYDGLSKLDIGMPKNSKVRLTDRGTGWITISSSEPQQEPINLSKLKAEIMRHWPMTNLLDVLKEADLMINFTD